MVAQKVLQHSVTPWRNYAKRIVMIYPKYHFPLLADLWSDEMKINLFGSDGFKRVWRRPDEKYKDKCVISTVPHGGWTVMVWGYMSAAGVGELYFIEGNMNSNMYCEIMQQSMIPSLQKLGHRAVFHHDNVLKHTSKTTTALLMRLKVKVMD